jgi:hypothetical protein
MGGMTGFYGICADSRTKYCWSLAARLSRMLQLSRLPALVGAGNCVLVTYKPIANLVQMAILSSPRAGLSRSTCWQQAPAPPKDRRHTKLVPMDWDCAPLRPSSPLATPSMSPLAAKWLVRQQYLQTFVVIFSGHIRRPGHYLLRCIIRVRWTFLKHLGRYEYLVLYFCGQFQCVT